MNTSTRFIPAIPTILLSSLLAVDFPGLLHDLHLSYLFIYPSVLTTEVLLVVASLSLKGRRSLVSISSINLLLATIALPLLETPVASTLVNVSKNNSVHLSINESFQNDDAFDFTITAQGYGSKEAFELHSGYTNISINRNFYSGPSLHYTFKPTLNFNDGPSVQEAFSHQGFNQLNTTTFPKRYTEGLKELATVRSETEFLKKFDAPSSSFSITPDGQTLYRTIFCSSPRWPS